MFAFTFDYLTIARAVVVLALLFFIMRALLDVLGCATDPEGRGGRYVLPLLGALALISVAFVLVLAPPRLPARGFDGGMHLEWMWLVAGVLVALAGNHVRRHVEREANGD